MTHRGPFQPLPFCDSMGLVMYAVCPVEHKSICVTGAAEDGVGALLNEIKVVLTYECCPLPTAPSEVIF